MEIEVEPIYRFRRRRSRRRVIPSSPHERMLVMNLGIVVILDGLVETRELNRIVCCVTIQHSCGERVVLQQRDVSVRIGFIDSAIATLELRHLCATTRRVSS